MAETRIRAEPKGGRPEPGSPGRTAYAVERPPLLSLKNLHLIGVLLFFPFRSCNLFFQLASFQLTVHGFPSRCFQNHRLLHFERNRQVSYASQIIVFFHVTFWRRISFNNMEGENADKRRRFPERNKRYEPEGRRCGIWQSHPVHYRNAAGSEQSEFESKKTEVKE